MSMIAILAQILEAAFLVVAWIFVLGATVVCVLLRHPARTDKYLACPWCGR